MWASSARAQSSLTPDEYNALVTAVETTTPQPANEAPLFGNFYTITHGESWPPLPANTMGLNYWPLGGNFYLLDDREVDYSASRADSSFGGLFPTNGGSGGGGWSEPDFSPQFTSNDLYLTILGVASNVASLGIHPPPSVTNGVYDVLYATNLTQPIPWQWMLRTAPGQMNLDLAGATNAQTFYRLGPPNYWLAFPDLISDGFNSMALYISSTVAASGNVMIRGQSNGPTVLVSGTSDDPDVNGTYVLTNLYIDPTKIIGNFAAAFLNGSPVSNVYAKGQYVIFYDENVVDSMGWVLANTNTTDAIYSGQYGAHNFNNVSWGYVNGDYINTPTTSCTEYTLNLPFSVAASNVAIVPIPNDVMFGEYNAVGTNNGIEVNATVAVTVYGVESDPESTAVFTAYPMPLLGTNYRLMARAASIVPGGQGEPFYSEYAVVATEDGTIVTNTPSATANLLGHVGTNSFTISLQQGQAYQLRSSDHLGDVTGTSINANHPIVVFAGANLAYVPDSNTQSGNPLVQEQFPTNAWGEHFFALSFAGRTNGDTYRVLSSSDGTTVSLNGKILTSTNESSFPYTVATSNETVTITTNANQFFDFGADGPVEIQANKPIEVAKFANGTLFDHPKLQFDPCDPCEILVLPTNLYSQTNVVFTLAPSGTNFVNGYLNIVAPQAAVTNIYFDGALLASTNFVVTNGFCFAQLVTTNGGAHTITSTLPIATEAYGWGNFDSYGFGEGIPK